LSFGGGAFEGVQTAACMIRNGFFLLGVLKKIPVTYFLGQNKYDGSDRMHRPAPGE
jgi:hypothetical protein